MRHRNAGILLLLLAAIYGCNCIPSGEPPIGQIVEIKKVDVKNQKSAREYFITNLSSFALMHMNPAERVMVEALPLSIASREGREVLFSVCLATALRETTDPEKADYFLTSSFQELNGMAFWTMKLRKAGSNDNIWEGEMKIDNSLR